jgi:hypothetical protein
VKDLRRIRTGRLAKSFPSRHEQRTVRDLGGGGCGCGLGWRRKWPGPGSRRRQRKGEDSKRKGKRKRKRRNVDSLAPPGVFIPPGL